MGGFELLSPRGLWLLLGAVPIVALYILKIRRPRQRVPSVWLWAAAQRDLLAKHPFKKLVAEVPLVLELLALAVLALALARPALRGTTITGDHVAIVVDTSASMGTLTRTKAGGAAATPGDGTRLAAAQKAALDVIAALSPGADAILIEGAREARIVSPLERDTRHLYAAVGSLAVREVEGDLGPAVALAADRLRTLSGRRKLVVITDGAFAHDAPLAASGFDTQVVTVGEPEDNAAIVRIDVRSGSDPPTRRDQVQVFALVKSYASQPRDAFLTLTIDGQTEPTTSRRLLLPPGENVPVVLTFEPRSDDQGKGLVVQLAPGDALPVDDVAYGRVPAGQKMPVTIASRAPYSWVGRALDADPDLSLQRIGIEQLQTVNVDPEALVVVEGACPIAAPGHDLLVVAPPSGTCLGINVGSVVDRPRITSWEAGDPRFRFLTLDGVHFAHATPLSTEGTGGALVRSDQGTLLADASLPGRTVTLLGFDPGDTDWPLSASFVLFIRNVVEVARLHRAQGTASPARTGDAVRFAVPIGVTSVRVEGPSMPEHEVTTTGGFAILPSVNRAGIYRARWSAPHVGEALVAVNLTSALESDVRPRPVVLAPSGATATATTGARIADAHHEVGTWLALVAAIAIALDLFWTTAESRPGRGPIRRTHLVVFAVGLVPLIYEALAHAEIIRETYVRFERPGALLVVAAAGALLAWRLARLPARMSPARRALVTICSSFALLATALAIAGPELGKALDRMTVIVAVDRSRSIDLVPDGAARIAKELKVVEKGMHDEDRIATIAFAADSATEDPVRPHSELPPPQRVEVGRDGTNIESAIRHAIAELPVDAVARIVLLSDGVQTRGDALSAAASAVAADVAVDVVVLEQKSVKDVRVVSVRAPPHANDGEALDLRVVTSSAVATDVDVRVKRDGELLHQGRARIGQGEDVLRLREKASEPGFHRYDVEISAVDPQADDSPEDNVGSAFVRVRGPSLALVIDGDSGKSAPMARALEANGFRVREGSTTSVPADLGALAGYDLVVLGDVPASDLATSQIEALASYARDLGGGLILMGGDRSMGPGGYARTPIEEISPVSFDLKENKRRASLAEIIAIDYSGSMGMMVGGQTKLALANEAAARSASLLGPGDRLGVEHVDTTVQWTIPMGPVTDASMLAGKIRAVGVGGGGIYTDIALQAGYEALDHETVNLKHVLLFADGDDAERITGCRALVTTASSRGMTTSVISLGRGHDTPELEVLSKVGGGRFYLVDDATKLPAVFTQETILAAKSAIHEEAFHASIGVPGPATRGVDFDGAPPLRGYVVTVPKARASTLLGGPDGDPLLATWAIGIGRAAAFTSDFKDRWGAEWLTWPSAVKMFGELGRDTARKADDPRVRLESDANAGELHVRADVIGDDGRTQSFRRLTVHVAGPDGFARDMALDAVGAGRYAASVPLSRPGVYVATAKDEVTGEAVGTTGAVLSAGEELRPTGSDRALLSRIATTTGGKVRDTLAGVYDDRVRRRFAYTSLTTPLVLLSAVAMVLGVGARRLGAPTFLMRAIARMRVRSDHARRRAEAHAAAKSQRQRAGDQERVNAALLATKQKTPRAPDVPFAPGVLGNAPSTPSSADAATRPNVPASPSPQPGPDAKGPTDARPARTLTSAERLARKRRERRG